MVFKPPWCPGSNRDTRRFVFYFPRPKNSTYITGPSTLLPDLLKILTSAPHTPYHRAIRILSLSSHSLRSAIQSSCAIAKCPKQQRKSTAPGLMDPRHTHKPTRVIREISRRTRTGTIPSSTVATQAHYVRQTPPTLPRNRTLPTKTWDLSKPLGLMSWCLPCLTFGKTQARNHDATLNGFSYCNADVSQSETSNKKKTPADER